MPNSDHSRNEYLKALLNASKNNQANEGVLVNPSNTLGNANTDISELAVLDTKISNQAKTPTVEQIKNVDDRNFWQRTMDSINEFRLNVLEGTFNFFGGIVDAGIWLGGAVGNVFGADTKWAEEAMAYDWESQALNFMNQTNWGQHIYSGDIFTKDYWQNWADMGSADASRENIDQVHSGSFVSDMGETGQQTYETITQGIGYILPSVLLAIGTGGASVGVQTAARATSLVGTGVSATGSGTQAALQDGADYYKAGASGLVSGAIEMGTEALSFGVGKLVGKVLGKTVSYGTRISGAQFGKAVAKLTANELGKAALEEGTEELIAELLSPFAKSVYKGGKAFNEYANPELYKQAVIAFAGGAVGGMFGGGIQSVNAKAKYTKQGVEILELTQEIAKMKQDNEGEFEKGDKADQQAIGVVEKRLGVKVKELTAKLETLKTSNPKAFDSVMKAIKNPEQAIKELEQSTGQKLTDEQKATFEKEYIGTPEQLAEKLGQSTIESVAEQDSLSLSKKLKTPTIIKIAKKGDFEMGNKGMANSEAFIDTDSYGRNIVWINPKFANRYYNIVAHEAISHGVIDTSEYNQSKLLKLADTTIKSDNLIELENGILELYEEEIKAELKAKSQAKFEKYAKNTKVFKAEKLAKWVETFVHDKKSLTRLLDTKASRSEISGLKALLSRIKKTLSPSKNAKLIKQIQNVLDKITDNQNETSEKTSTKLAPAYSKIGKIKDSVGNELTPKQQDYFKDSVVRDENGNLKVVYHGTKADFNTFLHEHISDSTGSMDFGYGFYFTDSEEVASGYGTTKSVYLDIKKPLSYDTKTITKADLSKLLKTLDADGEMGILSNFDDVSYIGYAKLLSKATNMLYDNNTNDVDIISEMINIDGGYRASKEFYNILKDTLGYDGIITKYHTKKDDVYVVFNSNQIKSIDNKTPTDSDDIRYSRTFDSVQASKDYAQHMQERVINMTTTKDVYNIMIDGIASAFGVDIKITNKEVLARQTTIAFNRLLNKPDELNKVVSGIINDILDSKIEYEVKANENQVARPLKVTLRKHLSDLGINVNEFFNDSISILKDILLDKSNDSKVEKLRNYYQSKIRLMALQVKEYRNKGIETIQVFKTTKKIIERLEKNKLPSQRGDRQIAELEFYRQATSGIKFSNSSKGISPSSVDRIINGLRSYEPKIIEKLQWLEYSKEIEDAVTFLMASQVEGKFPNRALTLDETHAVLTIMKNIAADMRKLESKAMAERIKLTERADLETKIVLQANKGYKSNFLQNELDAASSIDTIVGRYFGTNSATYRILYGDMYKAMDKQLLKQWEFFGEYEKLKKQHNIKDNQLNKRVEFKGEKLSLDLLLDMYIQSRTESGLATLQQGGYSIYNKGVTTHLQLSPQDIIALETILPNDMKVFGDKVLLDLYNGSLREYKANVDERIFGYKNVIEEIYYPSTKSDTSNAKFNNENDFKALDPSKTSFNQHRLNATKMSLRGMGFSERFKVYTNAITKYGETTESIKAFESLLNQFTTRADGTRATRLTLMAEAIPHFKTYIAYLQDQISGNMVDGTKTKGRMFTNIVSFTLAGNLSVVMKQTASIPSIMFEVKFSSWVKALAGAGGKIAKYRQSKAHLKQMSGILAERWGDYNLLKSKVLSENISQIAKFFGIPMARMDEAVIVVFGYAAAQYEAESLGLGRVGTPENDKAAIDILNRIVANTQSNAIPMKMSMNRAGANGFIRKALSYFSSDLQNKVSQLNMLLSEATNAKKQLEVIEKRISDNELAIEENNTKFDEFKKAHNMAEASDNAVAKLDDANAKQYYSFEQEAESLKSEKSALADMKLQKQEIIAGGGAEKALKLLFSLFLSGLMIASIEQLMARILGRKGWNENTSKDFAISLLLESTINNLPYVSTITNAIQYKADVGGYDFTLLNNLIDILGDITNMAKTGDWELTKILLYLSDTLGMMTGIPTKNLYNIAMGIWKQVGGSGFETDAIIKGYGSSYLSSELKKAVEGNHKNKAIGYLETLLATYKVGKTSSAIQSELLTLYSNGFNALPKNFMTSYIGDDRKSVELTDSQISVFRKHYEMGNKDANDLLAINEYKTATQENRAKSISKLYDAYYSYAKAKALNLDKADSRLANLLLYTNGNVDIAKYVIYLSKLGEIQESKAKSKKELSVEYINGLSNFTKPEKLLLMVLNGYSVGEKLQNQVLSYLSAKGMSRANAMTFLNIDK